MRLASTYQLVALLLIRAQKHVVIRKERKDLQSTLFEIKAGSLPVEHMAVTKCFHERALGIS